MGLKNFLELFLLLILVQTVFCNNEKVELKDELQLAHFFSNIFGLKAFDVNLLLEVKDDLLGKVLRRLQRDEQSAFSTYDLSFVKEALTKNGDCPIFVPYGNVTSTQKQSVYERNLGLMPNNGKPRLIIFWIRYEMAESKLSNLIENIALKCSQVIDHGPFDKDSIILFFSQNSTIIKNVLVKDISPLPKHPQVIGVIWEAGHHIMSVWQRVPFRNVEKLQLNFLWSPKQLFKSLEDLVPPIKSFGGEAIIVSTANFNQRLDKEGFIPRKFWTPAFHHIIAENLESLNADVKLKPALTRDIRLVDGNGSFLGQSQLIHGDLVDIAFHGYEYYNNMIGATSNVLWLSQRFTSFIAPNPKTVSKNFVLIYPFTVEVWVLLAVFAIFASIAFFAFSHLHGKIVDDHIAVNYFSKRAYWFVIATLLRHDSEMFHDHMRKTPQGRTMILLWLFMCLLMSSGYSGNLYSFLANPLYEDPIDDVPSILNSKLPWMWYRDNPSLEFLVSQSSDPDLQKLWEGHVPLRRQTGLTLHKLMEPVARGEYILISSSNLRLLVDIIFTSSQGNPLVYYPAKPLADIAVSKFSWFFPKMSRWSGLTNKFMRASVEGGLAEKWRTTSVEKNKIRFRKLYAGRTFVQSDPNEGKKVVTFQLSDVQVQHSPKKSKKSKFASISANALKGTFLLWVSMSGLAVIIFIIEKLMKKKEKN